MPKKPAKYGIDGCMNTLYLCVYLFTGKICYGKGLDLRERELSKPTQSVLQLAKPTEGSRRNTTADNWFSSKQLAQELKIKDLAYVCRNSEKEQDRNP